MDRVSSQLLRSAVASALVSAGFDHAAAVGLKRDGDGAGSAVDGDEGGREASDDGGAAAAMELDDNGNDDDVDAETRDKIDGVGWADLCSVGLRFSHSLSAIPAAHPLFDFVHKTTAV
jgi:hypothetical protein